MERDLLQQRAIRDSTQSLMLKIKAYYDVFRSGWAVNDDNPCSALKQYDFLSCTMEESVWIGNGLRGVKNMAQQMEIYSTFLRIIDLRMNAPSIVIASEDSVISKCLSAVHFQVLPATIVGISPYISTNEILHRRLIGRHVEPGTGLSWTLWLRSSRS